MRAKITYVKPLAAFQEVLRMQVETLISVFGVRIQLTWLQ